MKNILPYLLAVLLGAAIIALFITGRKKQAETFDDRVTIRRQDKIPYGTFVAFDNLPHVFPGAEISINKRRPAYADTIIGSPNKQALIIISPRFDADDDELKQLTDFIEAGNEVFISAQYISAATDLLLKCNSSALDLDFITSQDLDHNMSISLQTPPFEKAAYYSYPGRMFSSYFSEVDTAVTDIIGRDKKDRINFIRLSAGKGHLYVHLEPFAFSNYFLLHKQNMDYYEKALSLLPAGIKKVAWDEYYLNKKIERRREKKKGWFSVLMGMKNSQGQHPFRASFWLLIGLLLVYVLMEMRRKQRYIPVVARPKNDSLDFVKTIGRLYFDKGDHKNLGRKMSSYFLEYVRNKYKLATGILDESFIKTLEYKSGASEEELARIVSFIRQMDDTSVLSSKQLMAFHKDLESFYSKA